MKNRFKALIALVLFVALAWSALWGVGAYLINQQADKLFAANAQTEISCEEFSVTGYPFRYDVYCGNGTVRSQDTEIKFKGIKAATRIYSPTHLVGYLESPVFWTDEFTGSQRELSFSDAQWSVRANWQLELQRTSLVANQIAWADNLLGRFELANAEQFEAHLLASPDSEQGLQAFVKTTSANLVELALTETDARIEVDAQNFDRKIANWQNPNLLRDWQAADGILLVNQLDVKASTLAFTAEGEIALDQNGLLNGKITTKSKGLVELFEPEAYGPLAPTIFGVANSEGEYQSLWQANAGTISIGVAPLLYVPALF